MPLPDYNKLWNGGGSKTPTPAPTTAKTNNPAAKTGALPDYNKLWTPAPAIDASAPITPTTPAPVTTEPAPKVEPAKAYFSDNLDKLINTYKDFYAKNPQYKNVEPSTPYINQEGKLEEGRFLRKLGTGFVAGVASIPRAIGNIPKLFGGQPLDQGGWTDRLEATGKKYQEASDVLYGNDGETFKDKLASGIGSAGSYLIPSTGVAKGAGLLARGSELLPALAKYAPAIAKGAGIATMTGLESSQEAGQTYDDVYAKSGDQKKATQAAQGVAAANAVLIAATGKFGKYFEELPSGARNTVKRVLAGMFFEGGQEGGQQMIGNVATGKPIMEGVKDSALIGGIIGSGASIASAPGIFNKDGTVNKEAVLNVVNKEQNFVDLNDGPVEAPQSQETPAPQESAQAQDIQDNTQQENVDPQAVADNNWENSDEGQKSSQIHELINPLVQDFNSMTAAERSSPQGAALEEKIKELNNELATLQDSYIAKNQGNSDVFAMKANNAKGSVRIDKYEQSPKHERPASEFKLYEKASNIIDKYATRVGEGNIESRNALGTYNQKTKTIRVKGLNDISTVIHEVTHHIDFAHKVTEIAGKDGARLLHGVYMDYYPGAKQNHASSLKTTEGFAMLLQKYIEAPNATMEAHGEAVRQFLQEGGAHYNQTIGDIVNDLKKVVGEYQSLDPIEKIGARVTRDNNITGKESFLNRAEKIDTFATDAVYPIQKLEEIAGKKGTSKDASLFIRHYSKTGSYFANNVAGKNGYWAFENGEFSKKFDYNWGTLMENLGEKRTLKDKISFRVPKQEGLSKADKFDYLLVARRVHNEYVDYNNLVKEIEGMEDGKAKDDLQKQADKLKQVLENDGFDEQVVADAYMQYSGEFAKELEMFDNLTRADLDLLNSREIGLVDDEQYDKLTSKIGYASFKREFYDEIVGDDKVDSTNGGKKGKPSSLKERHGSSRTIISPLMSGVRNHSEILQKAMKQYVYNEMLNTLNTGKVDDYMMKVPLQTAVQDDGKILFPQERDPLIIMARDKQGKRVPIKTDAFIKDTLDYVLDFSSINQFGKVMTAFSRTFTKGTTSSFPPFAVANFIRDQGAAGTNTKYGYVPLISPLKTLYKAVIKKNSIDSHYWEEYLTLAGDRLAIGKQNEMSAKEFSDYMLGERKGILKAVDALNKGLDVIAAPAQFTESITRASEYIAARKKGASQVQAMNAAAELTTDFSRIGRLGGKAGDRTGTIFIRSYPYLNATVQSVRQLARTAHTPQGRKNIMFVTAATAVANIAAMSLLVANGSDDQKDIYKDLSPEELARYMYFPHPNGKTLVRIPAPEILTIPSSVANMIIAEKYFKTNYSVSDYVANLSNWVPAQLNVLKPKELVANWVPQAVKPLAKVAFNYTDYPSVRPLESLGQQRKPSENRIGPSTSALAIKVGKYTGEKFGLSPVQVDTIISGYLGRISGYVTGKPGIWNPTSTFTQKEYFEGGRRMQAYYATKKAVDEDYTAMKIGDKIKKGTTMTDEERKVKEVYRLVHGYGRGEEKVLGLEDLMDNLKTASEKNNTIQMAKVMKQISNQMEKIQKYDYK